MDERELEALLSVEPSPEFLARVRAAAADSPMISPFRRSLPALAGMTAMAAVLIAAGITTSRTNGLPPVSIAATLAPKAPARVTPTVLPAVDARSPAPASIQRPSPGVATLAATRMPEVPEVLLAPDVVRSFNEVVANASARRFEVSPDGLQALADTAIPESVIAPTNTIASDQGALQ
jgi:hypothetical protein